jgi:hypothetical protein
MDIGRAYRFVFDDPNWLKKVGIAALVTLIPVLGTIVIMGWSIEITRRVINNDPEPLPDWDNFSELLNKGLRAFAVSLAYMLPVIVIVTCGQLVAGGAIAGLATSSSDSTAMGTGMAILFGCIYCLVLILSIALGFFLMAANGRLAVYGEISAAFKFTEVIAQLRAAPVAYLMVILISWLTNMLLVPLGAIACGIGIIFTSALGMAISAHLIGQAYTISQSAQAATNSI